MSLEDRKSRFFKWLIRDNISQFIGLTNRDKIGDFLSDFDHKSYLGKHFVHILKLYRVIDVLSKSTFFACFQTFYHSSYKACRFRQEQDFFWTKNTIVESSSYATEKSKQDDVLMHAPSTVWCDTTAMAHISSWVA